MMNLRPYYYRTDGDGHEYFVPVEDIEEFDEWLELDADSDEFYNHPGFDRYNYGGSFYDVKLYIHVNDLNYDKCR